VRVDAAAAAGAAAAAAAAAPLPSGGIAAVARAVRGRRHRARSHGGARSSKCMTNGMGTTAAEASNFGRSRAPAALRHACGSAAARGFAACGCAVPARLRAR
jgi:hypothetical protein